MDAPAIAPDRFSGRKLGKYEVVCRLSTGGMAEIFLAFHRGVAGFQKLVVLKSILPDIRADEDIVRMFLDEAKITAAFNHPNIAHVYDLDVDDGQLFLAMEFVPGATLIEVAQATRKRGETIPTGFTLAAVRDAALALHYAHTFRDPLGRPRPVIHRDVAEKNVMVTYDGTTKLLDFGIAKTKDRITHTAVGKVKGTSGYMSPEQVVGEELDARSDVFSLGVVLHECLTGLRLFYGKDAEQGMLAALNQTPAPPSKQNPEVSAALDAVTLKALARSRDERFGSALELARALEKAAPDQLWHPERCGELVARLFAGRRAQTQELLEQMSERTGEVNVAQLLKADRERKKDRTEKPPAPVERKVAEPTRPDPPPSRDAAALELLRAVAAPASEGLHASDSSKGRASPLFSPPPVRPPSADLAEEQTVIKPPRREQPREEDEDEMTVQAPEYQERPSPVRMPARPGPTAPKVKPPLIRPGLWIGAGVVVAIGVAAAAYFLRWF